MQTNYTEECGIDTQLEGRHFKEGDLEVKVWFAFPECFHLKFESAPTEEAQHHLEDLLLKDKRTIGLLSELPAPEMYLSKNECEARKLRNQIINFYHNQTKLL